MKLAVLIILYSDDNNYEANHTTVITTNNNYLKFALLYISTLAAIVKKEDVLISIAKNCKILMQLITSKLCIAI